MVTVWKAVRRRQEPQLVFVASECLYCGWNVGAALTVTGGMFIRFSIRPKALL